MLIKKPDNEEVKDIKTSDSNYSTLGKMLELPCGSGIVYDIVYEDLHNMKGVRDYNVYTTKLELIAICIRYKEDLHRYITRVNTINLATSNEKFVSLTKTLFAEYVIIYINLVMLNNINDRSVVDILNKSFHTIYLKVKDKSLFTTRLRSLLNVILSKTSSFIREYDGEFVLKGFILDNIDEEYTVYKVFSDVTSCKFKKYINLVI